MTIFRIVYLGHNGKQDWHGVRRCPHTGGLELASVEQADQFTSKAAAEALRQQYERTIGGSRTVLQTVEPSSATKEARARA
jgi:hypothetical protein